MGKIVKDNRRGFVSSPLRLFRRTSACIGSKSKSKAGRAEVVYAFVATDPATHGDLAFRSSSTAGVGGRRDPCAPVLLASREDIDIGGCADAGNDAGAGILPEGPLALRINFRWMSRDRANPEVIVLELADQIVPVEIHAGIDDRAFAVVVFDAGEEALDFGTNHIG